MTLQEKLEAARKELQQAKDERNRLTGQFKTVPESQSALKLTPKAIEAIREKKKGLKFQDLRSLDARIEYVTLYYQMHCASLSQLFICLPFFTVDVGKSLTSKAKANSPSVKNAAW